MMESPSSAAETEVSAAAFEPEVAEVLQSLRQSIAATLSGIGDFGKPADIFKALELDRTLSRQLYRLASTAEPVGNGGMIPSRTSIDRFLNAVRSRGASELKIADVHKSYQAFEKLVQTHAGDRATFNSMVSAAGGIDEDWLATDLQHRRNAFRAMSHALGLQMKTRFATFIVNGKPGDSKCDFLYVGGSLGLKVLRSLPAVHVFGTVGFSPRDTTQASCGPIGLSTAGDGYILEEFSSSPLPKLLSRRIGPENSLSSEVYLENPVVGNVGSTTLMFGSVFRKMPMGPNEPLRFHSSANQPTEKLLLDVLLPSGLRGDARPAGSSVIGFQFGSEDKYGSSTIHLQGRFEPEYLGKGVRSLATLDVPRYTEMAAAVAGRHGLVLDDFEAWRLRVDFPLFQSTISMVWR